MFMVGYVTVSFDLYFIDTLLDATKRNFSFQIGSIFKVSFLSIVATTLKPVRIVIAILIIIWEICTYFF